MVKFRSTGSLQDPNDNSLLVMLIGYSCMQIRILLLLLLLDSFIQMCSDLTIDKAHTNYIITKLSTIVIRTTYYIFCMRNKPWTNPELLSY